MKKKTAVKIIGLALVLAALALVLILRWLPAARTPAAPEMPADGPAAVIPEPTQSAATAPVPTAQAFADSYFRVVGSFHPGTAGSSLRQAQAACAAVHFAASNRLAEADIPGMRSAMLAAWESLTDDERSWFDENFIGLAELVEACHADWESNRALFEDAGVADQMAILTSDPAAMAHWDTLRANTLTLGNEEG